jgi:hypothetical protein
MLDPEAFLSRNTTINEFQAALAPVRTALWRRIRRHIGKRSCIRKFSVLIGLSREQRGALAASAMHRPIKCLYTSAGGKCLAVTAPYPWRFPALPAYGPLPRKACLCACLGISHSIFEPGVATAGQGYYRLGPVVSFCPSRTGLGVPCAAASRRNVISSRADARRIRNSLGRQARDNRSG